MLSFCLLLGASAPLPAGDFAYGLGYSVTHSDNVTRVPVDERSEVTHSYLAGLYYVENTANLAARVLANVEYQDYRDDVFEDESVFNLDSSLVWTISPQRFTWTVEDAYEQTRISTTVADTPDNRANVNVFSTGPDVYVRFNPVNTLALGARAGNVYTGRANTDNNRFNGAARWLYQATSVSTYSLNFQALDVMYDDDVLNADFTRTDLFFRADYRPSRSQYIVDFGASRIKPDQGSELEGTLARFSWNRQLTPESTFGVSATGEYSDTGTDILAASTAVVSAAGSPLSPASTTGFSSSTVTDDVYYAKRGYVYYTRQGSRFALEVSALSQDIDFETTLQDRKETVGSLSLDVYYANAASVRLFADHVRTRYQNFERNDTDRDYGIRLGYRLSRSLSLALEGRRSDLVSSVPDVDFVENRALLSILYSSSPLFSSSAR